MKLATYFLAAVTPLVATLTAGCQSQAFQPAGTLAENRTAADLIVSGRVAQVDTLGQFGGSDVMAASGGKVNADCAVERQAVITVDRSLKGGADVGQPLTFSYFEPCERQYNYSNLTANMGWPYLTTGDHVVVYLQNDQGRWRLLDHRAETPANSPRPDKHYDSMFEGYFGPQP
jgi:hypothetical protein